jgi:hypothetical protein
MRFSPRVALLCTLFSAYALAAEPLRKPFPRAQVVSTDADGMRELLAHGRVAPRADRQAHAASQRLADGLHLLMPEGADAYEKVVIGPTHLALVRRSGIIDVVAHSDAEAQVHAGPARASRIEVGSGPRGNALYAEEGPGGTIRLYRQLPLAAKGEISSRDGFTSFALTAGDAYHPFDAAGKTVTLSIPRSLFERVRSGELGGTGWAGNGGIGIDVLEEVQIDSRALRLHLGHPPQ